MVMQINMDITVYTNLLVTDLQLFTSYLFKTHQVYMIISLLLLLLALFLSIFLSTKYVNHKTQKAITYEK